jgi:O-acetyl-ADP-ribose deacetylase (regulator of RNase III)
MQIVTGDLVELALQGQFDVVVQGCNCMCQMGKGVALTIKNTWPEVYATDCLTTKGSPSKLGTVTVTTVKVANNKPLAVVNAYTQYKYASATPDADYTAIKDATTLVQKMYTGKKIGISKIGCGLAGGDWNIVLPILEEVFASEDVTVVIKD